MGPGDDQRGPSDTLGPLQRRRGSRRTPGPHRVYHERVHRRGRDQPTRRARSRRSRPRLDGRGPCTEPRRAAACLRGPLPGGPAVAAPLDYLSGMEGAYGSVRISATGRHVLFDATQSGELRESPVRVGPRCRRRRAFDEPGSVLVTDVGRRWRSARLPRDRRRALANLRRGFAISGDGRFVLLKGILPAKVQLAVYSSSTATLMPMDSSTSPAPRRWSTWGSTRRYVIRCTPATPSDLGERPLRVVQVQRHGLPGHGRTTAAYVSDRDTDGDGIFDEPGAVETRARLPAPRLADDGRGSP